MNRNGWKEKKQVSWSCEGINTPFVCVQDDELNMSWCASKVQQHSLLLMPLSGGPKWGRFEWILNSIFLIHHTDLSDLKEVSFIWWSAFQKMSGYWWEAEHWCPVWMHSGCCLLSASTFFTPEAQKLKHGPFPILPSIFLQVLMIILMNLNLYSIPDFSLFSLCISSQLNPLVSPSSPLLPQTLQHLHLLKPSFYNLLNEAL